MNIAALKMAREVADKHGCLMAGNICNSSVYLPDDKESHKITEAMFKVREAYENEMYMFSLTKTEGSG
jgi:betaine-homocysteine S-methyltransferase